MYASKRYELTVLNRGEHSSGDNHTMIDVEEITKRYAETVAVDHLSFRVKKGEILGLLGPNGAGKTTTMRILTGYLAADAGKITVAGWDLPDQSLEIRRHIGYLPENNPLYPDMGVMEYLSFHRRYAGVAEGGPTEPDRPGGRNDGTGENGP